MPQNMKPSKIFLIRHGQSEGNKDPNIYDKKPDYQLELTDLGIQQAKDAGEKLKQQIGDANTMFYVSPLWRTRSTFKNLIGSFRPDQITWQEEPRLREQEWGHLRKLEESKRINAQRDDFGCFYYRIPNGESGADVYDRVSSFMGSLHRDFEKKGFPDNVVLVTHGLTLRLFLMKWFHWTVEQFDEIKNPYNCQIFELEKYKNKYKLITPTTKYELLPEYKSKNHKPLELYG